MTEASSFSQTLFSGAMPVQGSTEGPLPSSGKSSYCGDTALPSSNGGVRIETNAPQPGRLTLLTLLLDIGYIASLIISKLLLIFMKP